MGPRSTARPSVGRIVGMRDSSMPPSRFRRFEKVVVANAETGGEFLGQVGTVLWCDRPCRSRATASWGRWGYALYFPALGRYGSYLDTDLEPTGEFDAEESLLGRRFELT